MFDVTAVLDRLSGPSVLSEFVESVGLRGTPCSGSTSLLLENHLHHMFGMMLGRWTMAHVILMSCAVLLTPLSSETTRADLMRYASVLLSEFLLVGWAEHTRLSTNSGACITLHEDR